jgi:cell wall-associated NlpC family hydrolase
MTRRDDILRIARGYLGVRFRHQGRSRNEGVDCLGLLLAVARDTGLTLHSNSPDVFDRRDYTYRPDVTYLQSMLERLLTPATTLEPTHIALLNIEGRPQHLAMLSDYPEIGELGMIHAFAPARKVVEHRFDAHWQGQLHAAYQLPIVI